MQQHARRSLAAVGLLLALGGAFGRAHAQEPASEASPSPVPGPAVVAGDGERYITMDFQDVDLAVLVKFMGEITGKNFVMDERVQGKVSVVSPTRITPEEAYQVFQAVLQVKGFTTVPSGAAVRIIPTKDAKATSLRTMTEGGGRAPVEEYVTRLVPLTEVDAADLVTTLQPLVSADGLITAYPQTNTLIIIDSAANVDRLIRVVQELDVASSRRRTELFRLKYAAASEVADTIQQAMEERPVGAPAAQPGKPAPAAGMGLLRAFKLTPDDRTNTLIVNAAAEQMRQIKGLIERLDVPLPPGSGRVNVFYLQNADADEMLPVLLDLIGSSGGGAARPRQNANPQQPGGVFGGNRSNRASGSSFRRASGNRMRNAIAAGQAGGGAPGQTGQQAIEFSGDVRITSDPATNALVIAAAPEDYATLVSVIEKLDIRRRQVYVEAIILEVSLDRLQALGIELQGGVSLGNGVGFGRTNLGTLNTALTNPAQLAGGVLGAISSQTITLPDGTKVPAQVALLTALQNDNDTNILSAPNIVTTDNEEAEIIVGQNVPFVASRSSDTTNLSNVFNTIEREDVGITLRLTPQISDGSVVRLAIFEEVSALVPNPQLDANEVGPTTTVRSASTTVTVKDGQTIVIGGLISDSLQSREAKVPFFGDIPVLGNLFKREDTTKNKINLLIFLTPHIIKDDREAADLSVQQRDRFKERTQRSEAPRLRPDPLDMSSFELPEDATNPVPDTDGAPAGSEDPGAAPSTLTVGSITVDRRHDGAVVAIDVGLPPERIAHYALESPGRYVIDVYGPSRGEPQLETLHVRDPLVKKVRVAHHRGRMRLVIDLATDVPPAYAVENRGGTILVTLGAARSTARAAAAP